MVVAPSASSRLVPLTLASVVCSTTVTAAVMPTPATPLTASAPASMSTSVSDVASTLIEPCDSISARLTNACVVPSTSSTPMVPARPA